MTTGVQLATLQYSHASTAGRAQQETARPGACQRKDRWASENATRAWAGVSLSQLQQQHSCDPARVEYEIN